MVVAANSLNPRLKIGRKKRSIQLIDVKALGVDNRNVD